MKSSPPNPRWTKPRPNPGTSPRTNARTISSPKPSHTSHRVPAYTFQNEATFVFAVNKLAILVASVTRGEESYVFEEGKKMISQNFIALC